jgi:hypothetical protein
VQKSKLLLALQQELRRHYQDFFCTEEKSVAQGGKGVIVSGCPVCKKAIYTQPQFMTHLTEDVLPALLDKLSAQP